MWGLYLEFDRLNAKESDADVQCIILCYFVIQSFNNSFLCSGFGIIPVFNGIWRYIKMLYLKIKNIISTSQNFNGTSFSSPFVFI